MRNNTFKDNVLRVVAVLGLIVVLLLGAWGIIQLAFWLPSLFSDISGNIGGIFKREPAQETLTISLPTSVVAGTPFTLSWTHKNGEGERNFGLAYQCREGVTFETTQHNGGETITCDTPYALPSASSSIQLVARLASSAKATPVGVSVAATTVDGTIMATSTGGTVVNPAATSTTTTPKPATTKPATSYSAKPATTYYASGRTSNLYGTPDLSVAINAAYTSGGRAVAQFTVSNIGTNVSPANWFFTAALPINGGYTYQSPAQQALYPGDRIVYTMGYDSVGNYGYGGQNCGTPYYQNGYSYVTPCFNTGPSYGGQQTVTIMVDPYNLIYEANKYNNSASQSYSSQNYWAY